MKNELLLLLGVSLMSTACQMDVDEELDSTKSDETAFAANNVNAQNSLRFTNLQASCSGAGVSFTTIGADLAALIDNEVSANGCVVVGTLEVPRGVYLQRLNQIAEGFSDGEGQLRYRALLNGQEVGSGSRNSWGSVSITRQADVSAIGRQLCATGRATRVPIRIEGSLPGVGSRNIDSFDWSFASVGYCE